MTDAELKDLLEAAQSAIADAVTNEDYEALPVLISDRASCLEELVQRTKRCDQMRAWARQYLAADREVMAEALRAREKVHAELRNSRKKTGANVAYLEALK